jgi:hypothetical protein
MPPHALAVSPSELSLRQLSSALDETGAVLLQAPDWGVADFEAFTQRICSRFHNSGARGALREGDGFTTSTFSMNFTLLSHTEGTFRPAIDAADLQPLAPHAPDVGFLFCEVAPIVAGGETTLVDGTELLTALDPALRTRFEREGVGYHMVWEPERWQNELGATSREQLASLLAQIPGTSFEFRDDTLHLFYRTEAITTTRSGARAFATALLAHLPHVPPSIDPARLIYSKGTNRVCFGQGEDLPDSVVQHLIEIHDALAHSHRWHPGDLLILDNTRTLHGRNRTAVDCERKLKSRFGWLRGTPHP